MEKTKKRIPWLAIFSLAFAYGATFNPPYIRYFLYDSMIEAMGCTNMQLSFLTTVAVIIGIIVSVPGGWVADRFSAKKILIVSLLANVPFIVLSSVFIKTYWIHLITWGAFGFTGGFAFWPAVLKGIRIIGGEDNQSKAYGIFEASQGLIATIGNMIALAIFARFIDSVFGFKMAFLFMGIFDAVAAAAVLLFFKEEPAEDKTKAGKEEKDTSGKVTLKDTITLLKNPSLWLVSITLAAVYGIYVSQSYMTPYFTGVLGAALTITGIFAIMRDYGMKVVGGPFGGVVADKIGSPSLLNAICLIGNAILVFIVSRIKTGGANVVAFAMIFVLVECVHLLYGKGDHVGDHG